MVGDLARNHVVGLWIELKVEVLDSCVHGRCHHAWCRTGPKHPIHLAREDEHPDGLAFDERELRWDRQVNASVLVRPDGTHDRAEKIGLTPFGEFLLW